MINFAQKNQRLTFFFTSESSYWNIPQNETVLEKIDLHCQANELRLHLLGPPPSICQRARLPAEVWDIWMAHSIKHVTLWVTFQTAPQASSITFTSTSKLAERGSFEGALMSVWGSKVH